MTFINDDLPVGIDQRVHFARAGRRLHDRVINAAGGPRSATDDVTPFSLPPIEGRAKPGMPLLAQFRAVYENKRTDLPPRYDRRPQRTSSTL